MFCRTRRPGRFFCRGMRIRRAGHGPHRRPAGDQRIYHQLLGSGRRCFTIEKVSHSSETGELYDGCVDLATREAPSSGLSSPWEAFSRRAAMPRQSFLGIHFVFRKFEKSDPRNFQRGLPALSNLWEFWNADKWAEQHGYACSYALARESRTVTQREETLK